MVIRLDARVARLQTIDSQHMLRFMTVGMLGTLIDVGLFATLHLGLGLPAVLANVVSYGSGSVNSYILHRRWTFANLNAKAVRVQLAQFLAVSLCSLLVNSLMFAALEPALERLFASSATGDVAAKACAMSAGMCVSFVAHHLWTFRPAPDM